jgi:glycosyltransferase involved in cell wall biosynthesis
LPQPRWRKELIRLWSHINQHQQDAAASKSLTFVNSRKLYEQYAGRLMHLVETRTTTLSKHDFYVRENTCLEDRVRLLYVGRYERSKGLAEIIRALQILVRDGNDVVLDFVGWDDSGTGVVAELLALADQLGVRDRVTDHGRKAVGPELFAMYKTADIFVTASKTSEGFPRTIWEAMAHSLPVVATPIGSIPHFVGSAAEFASPGDVASLATAIGHLLTDSNLRRARICAGLELARGNTLELRSRDLIDNISLWARTEA